MGCVENVIFSETVHSLHWHQERPKSRNGAEGEGVGIKSDLKKSRSPDKDSGPNLPLTLVYVAEDKDLFLHVPEDSVCVMEEVP